MWYGDNYLDLETRYFRRLLLGLCFWDLVAMFVNSIIGSKFCSEPLVRNELSRYFVAVHRSRTKGFIVQSHVFYYNTEEERRPFSKGIHVTTLATPSLSSPDLRYRFRLTYPDYPRLTWSQCLQWSFVTWLMCFYVELPKHSHWQRFPRWHRWCRTATLAFGVAGSTAWQVNSVRYVVWKHQEAPGIPPKERTQKS